MKTRIAAATALGVALLWLGTLPLSALEVYPIQRVVLPNGLTIVAKVDHRLDLVGVHTFVGAGWSQDPAGKEGLTSLLVKAMAAGSKEYPPAKMVPTLDRVGAYLHAGCERELSYLRSEVVGAGLSTVLAIHADVIRRPAMATGTIERIRKRLLDKLASSRRHPTAEGFLHDELRGLLYGNRHPYGTPKLGSEQGLRRITRNDLVAHHREHVRGNGITISLVGDFVLKDVIAQAMKLFGAIPAKRIKRYRKTAPAAPEPLTRARERRTGLPGLRQTHVSIGFLGPSILKRDFFAMALIEALLGSLDSTRLQRRFADKPDICDVKVHFPRSLAPPDFKVFFKARTANVDWAVALILEEIEKLKHRLVDRSVLERARRLVKNAHAFEAPRRVVRSYLVGRAEVLDEYEFYQTYFDEIDRVTPEDLLRVARTYFGVARYALTILHPEGEATQKRQTLVVRTLPNGLRVIVKPEFGDNIIGIAVGVGAGSWLDPKGEEGLNQLLFSTLQHGSSRSRPYEGVKSALEDIGGGIFCHCDLEYGAVLGLATTFFLDEALALYKDLVAEPVLDGDGFKRAQTSFRRKQRSMNESPSENIIHVLHEKIFANHPFGRRIFGTEESLANITPDALTRFHRKHFVPSNMTVVLVGDVSAERAISAVERSFGTLPAAKAPTSKIPTSPHLTVSKIVRRKEAGDSTHLALGFLTPGAFKDFAACTVLFNALGWGMDSIAARVLAKERIAVRKPLAAHFQFKGPHAAVAAVIAEVDAKDAKRLPGVVKEILKKLKKKRFTLEEIETARRKLHSTLVRQHENKLARAVDLFWSHRYAPDPLFTERLAQAYRKITPDDVTRVARKYLKHYRLILIGP